MFHLLSIHPIPSLVTKYLLLVPFTVSLYDLQLSSTLSFIWKILCLFRLLLKKTVQLPCLRVS